ncbi:response regulator transcription factor [Synoicihabitans lomoniglobus]|uniref:Response regulator n=1 Tax=Synoicihabitans lomoniglobus TaxID=2909285 RepID=A0AAE9ZV43_9BACT|nr:response regulator [Opitutaceae bacterium LMO-M01]WED64662.1 response regulator [Opitutaceae bacterium LMO-M01]
MPLVNKVLLVDDEVHIRKYIGLVVKSAFPGVTVIDASNGHEATEIYETEKPDLVLMDINMPVRDGIETLGDLMAIDEDAVIVMLTSVSTRSAVEKASALGAAGYILKDTPREEISNSLLELADEIFGED